MKKVSGFILGVILIVCGMIYMLDILGIANINFSLNGWWCLFIIVPCLDGLLFGRDKIGSTVGLAFGILLMLAAQEVIEYEVVWNSIVPIIIIVIGMKTVRRSLGRVDKPKKADGESEEYNANFSSQSYDFSDREINVAKVGAVFGGSKCNLTDAKIKNGSRLNVFCLFGGAEIIVPENINLKINSFCLFGGISDKRATQISSPENPTLEINGCCIFGGADIK